MAQTIPGGKIGVFAVLLGLACVAAGLFGMAHNQISVSVGPTYFSALKFPQFAIPEGTGLRWGAALVGWQASWWMGLFAGLPVLGYGLMRAPSAAALWAGGIGAIATVLFVAGLSAMAGLAVGFAVPALGLPLPYTAPPGVTPGDFTRAGAMHDASYFGGLLGALIALWPMRTAIRHFTRQATQT